ncbi:hypothetical protein HMPREF9141_1841 [Prevotella multiformis DSM 16608]|uniref:Uncharacterized protein n=1 Tax=Prevotella multiformis DSM 16608 TaxID=888743 RepID=F0F8C4_9BACT|nr:hypothetical protein HMPREF9141_1841 [Prevotella multiformis DSM 16608]
MAEIRSPAGYSVILRIFNSVDGMAEIRSPAGGLIFAAAGKRPRQLREDSVCIESVE